MQIHFPAGEQQAQRPAGAEPGLEAFEFRGLERRGRAPDPEGVDIRGHGLVQGYGFRLHLLRDLGEERLVGRVVGRGLAVAGNEAYGLGICGGQLLDAAGEVVLEVCDAVDGRDDLGLAPVEEDHAHEGFLDLELLVAGHAELQRRHAGRQGLAAALLA